jgi:isoleucyl-tRNA synthetase
VSGANIFNTLFDIDLAEVCITSNAMATNDDAPAGAFTLPDVPGVAVVVEKAVGTKCARSWKILPTVGEDAEYPDVSPRDAQALREWKALAGGEKPVDAVEAPVAPVRLVEPQPAEPEQLSNETTEQAVQEAVTADKPAKKVRPKKAPESTQAMKAETPAKVTKAAAAEKVVEAEEPKAKKTEAKKGKAKKAKARTTAKKDVAKKPVAKKAKAKKATKSKKASSATKGAKKAATKKAATKKAVTKGAAKKASRKKAAKKPATRPPAPKAKKKKKKAR